MAIGDIGAVIDTLEFDPDKGKIPSICHVSGNIYAIAYSGPDSDGWLGTVEILANGQIGAAFIDTLEFDAAQGINPWIVHVSGTTYAIAYGGPDNHGWLGTVEILANGQIGAAFIDTLEFDPVEGRDPHMIHVSGDVYVIVYEGPGLDGWMCTVEILANGQIGAGTIDTLEFRTASGWWPYICHVSGTTYAIVYSYEVITDYYGWVCTVDIQNDGQIGADTIDTLEFDSVRARVPIIMHVSGDVYAIPYSGPDDDGWICTVEILANGQIGADTIDTLEFDATHGFSPSMLRVSGTMYAIAYEGPDDDGWVCTLVIENNGQIAAAVHDSLEFDTVNGEAPTILYISGNTYAIAYNYPFLDDDGWLCSLAIETVNVAVGIQDKSPGMAAKLVAGELI